MNQIQLTQKLISIPSYVNDKNNEVACADWIYDYLSKNTKLQLTKQSVEGNRYNLIAKGPGEPKLLIIGHIDTVEPKSNNQLKPILRDNKLYGLGSSDMKGSLASTIKAVEEVSSTDSLMLLFYIDEEYDFAGSKSFVNEYKSIIKPELILGEGSDLKLTNGCRGLIEITFEFFGQTGHAARPDSGINAISTATNIMNQLKYSLEKEIKPFKTTLNQAGINGGLILSQNSNLELSEQGNNIADYCRIVVDIRPGNKKIDAQWVVDYVSKLAEKCNVEVKSKVRHNLGSWYTPRKDLTKVEMVVKETRNIVSYTDPNQTGYLDTQLFASAFDCPCVGFGPGIGNQAHQAKEYIPVKNLELARNVYQSIIKKMLK